MAAAGRALERVTARELSGWTRAEELGEAAQRLREAADALVELAAVLERRAWD